MTPARTRRSRRGATLVELLVALLIFDMALLTVAAVSALAVRRLGDAERRNRAAIMAASRIEWLASQSCRSASSGALPPTDGITETWSATPLRGARELVDSVGIHSRTPETIVLRARVAC
jgi:Tfp pilus assembly protein PilV